MRSKILRLKFGKKAAITAIVVVISVALILGSFIYINFQRPNAGNIESITIGTVPNETNSLIYVANDQKYFAANGLNITLKSYPSGLADAKAVLNGEINIGIATEFIVAEEAFDNVSLYVLGTDSKFSSFSMVARTDQGINGVADLNGKVIGVSFGTIAQFYLGDFLN